MNMPESNHIPVDLGRQAAQYMDAKYPPNPRQTVDPTLLSVKKNKNFGLSAPIAAVSVGYDGMQR
jgi:hypothetical protein